MNNLTPTQLKKFRKLQRISLYLCGPMLDCTNDEMSEWRKRVKSTLIAYPISIADPTTRDYRQVLKEAQTYEDIQRIDEEIITNDLDEIAASHALFCGIWKHSSGSAMEIYEAWKSRKFIVSIVPNRMNTSAWIRYHSTEVVENYPDAIVQLRKYFPTIFGLERGIAY